MASIIFQGKVYFCPHVPFLLSCHNLFSLVSWLFCMMHGYLAANEKCCVPVVVKCTLFTVRVASLLLDASFNITFATCIKLLLLDVSFKMKL